MRKIKQVFPVPQGRKYYAVYSDDNEKSGYFAERVDYIALVKDEYGSMIFEGISGYLDLSSDCNSYYGTYSEDALRAELPELWETIKENGIFQDELSPVERYIMERCDALHYQNEQINLLKEKIAALEKGKADAKSEGLSVNE